jgi:hypothetical protein
MSSHALEDHPHIRSRSAGSDSSRASSSGALTPTAASVASSSGFLSSSVSNLWGGLIRRFSSDAASHFGTSSTTPSLASSFHHSHTYADRDDAALHNGLDGVYTPPSIHRAASPMPLPPLEPLQLEGFREDTAADARLLTSTIAEEIRIMIPARLTIVDRWDLVYSLDQDGASLATLYEKCSAYEGKRAGFVLVVKDNDGGVS